MAVEPLWSAQDLNNLGAAMVDLQNRIQEWEGDFDLKVGDLMINIETMTRPVSQVGLVTLQDKGDTVLQFEALEAQIGLV